MLIAVYVIFAQIAVGWYFIQYVLTHERGPKEPKKAVIATAALGVVSIALALGLEYLFLSKKLIAGNPKVVHELPTIVLLANCLLIGVIEELSKALPVTIFVSRKPYFNEMTDGIIYYGVAGMIFGVLESISYTLSLGFGAGIAKIITGPFTHAALSSIIGYNVARYKFLKKSFMTVIAGAIGAISLHGLYDFGLFSGNGWLILMSLAITLTINLGIFWLFGRAKRLDERRGLSAIGNNLYCRNCGWPNRYHYLYCTHCGQKA